MQPASTTIVSPDGAMVYSFGGDDAASRHEMRGYHVSIEMVGREMGMCIWPLDKTTSATTGVYVVCLSAAPHWLEVAGGPTREAFRLAARGLEVMGQDVTVPNLHALVDVVVRFFPDVMMARPRKRARPPALFEASATADGRPLHEKLA